VNSYSTEHQKKIFVDRYRDKENPKETVEGMFNRVAIAAAVDTITHGMNREEQVQFFYNGMVEERYITAGRPLANLGTNGNGMVFNCFVLPIEDSRKGITSTLADFTEIAAKGGGIGISYSRLRPKGTPTKQSKGTASGPVSFIDVFQCMGGTIKQQGSRGLASMTSLHVSHPDIEEFIKAKTQDGRWPTTNLSVEITDAFIRAVKDDTAWELKWNGKVYDTVSARRLWDVICESAHRNGEPGLLFVDTMNERSPYKGVERIETTNPCQPDFAILWDGDRFRRIDDPLAQTWTSWKVGVKEVVKATTNTGLEFYTTPNHVALLANGEEKPVQDCVGEVLYAPAEYPLELSNKVAKEDKKLILKGFLFGDGFMCGKKQGVGVRLNAAREPEVAQLLVHLGFAPQASGAYYLNYQTLVQAIGDCPFLAERVFDRIIPHEILFGERDVFVNFLRGLFAANGSCNTGAGQISLKTTNLKAAQDVQLLLGVLGIHASITGNAPHAVEWHNGTYVSRQSYNVQIPASYGLRFQEQVGFIADAKRRNVRATKCNRVKIQVKEIVSVGEMEVWDYRMNTLPHYNYCQGTILRNCNEQPLPPNSACNLGSVILPTFVNMTHNKGYEVDYTGIWTAAYDLTIMLDNLIDVSTYPTPETEANVKKYRPVGVGAMGLADVLLYCGVPYGDNPEALSITETIVETIADGARAASEDLAAEKGTFPAYDGTIMNFAPRRNITLTSYAPTGTISAFCDVSSGIEPHFSPVVRRKEEIGITVTPTTAIQRYMDFHKLTEIPAHARFSISGPEGTELTIQDHLKILEVVANHCDTSASKTINLPEEATIEDVSNVFMFCWEHGIKGCTVYRTNSRSDAPIQAPTEAEEEDEDDDDVIMLEDYTTTPKERPNVLDGRTYKIKPNPNDSSIYITINDSEEEPFEIFFTTNNAVHQEYLDGLSRAITALWRRGVRGDFLFDDFCRYESPSGGTYYEYEPGKHKRIKSILDAIGTVIKRHVKLIGCDYNSTEVPERVGELPEVVQMIDYLQCPECKEYGMNPNDKCPTCEFCGFSRCG
jgi:ribonucleoside-diphosphate reductase alpha chain